MKGQIKLRLERQQALIRDLRRLESEIPELIAHIELGNQSKTKEALVLLTRGRSGQFEFLMDKLTTHVVDEAMKGNKEPLRKVASGELWD
jgi:hypothetical protein